MLIAADNTQDGSGLETETANPLTDESRAGPFDGFCTQQGVHDGPRGFVGCTKHLMHVEPHLVIGPDSALIGQNLLPGVNVHGLGSQSLHE